MAVMDKIMFWKKKEEGFKDPFAGEGAGPSPDPFASPASQGQFQQPGQQQYPGQNPNPFPTGMEDMDQHEGMGYQNPSSSFSPPSYPQPSSFGQMNQGQGQYQQQMQPASGMSRDMEMISIKLDSIRAQLESMNQRLMNLERIASPQDHNQRKMW